MYMATTEMHRVCLKNSPTLLKIVMSDFDDISQLAEIFNTVYSYFRCPVWKEKLVKNAKTYMKTNTCRFMPILNILVMPNVLKIDP